MAVLESRPLRQDLADPNPLKPDLTSENRDRIVVRSRDGATLPVFDTA